MHRHAVERDLQLGPVRERGLVEGHDHGAVDDAVLHDHGFAVADEGPGAGADLEGEGRRVEGGDPLGHQRAVAGQEVGDGLAEELVGCDVVQVDVEAGAAIKGYGHDHTLAQVLRPMQGIPCIGVWTAVLDVRDPDR